jgi:hypothetical protein
MIGTTNPIIEALGDPPAPKIPGGEMKCSLCTQITPDSWATIGWVPGAGLDFTSLQIEWMRCANEECQQAFVRLSEMHSRAQGDELVTDMVTWFARPHGVTRAIDPLVEEPFRTDYLEAAAILDLSPRMSAVLARGILADLLERYTKLDDFNLSDRVDKFRADNTHPSNLRENIHHFREIANFGAHTQKNDQDQIIPVTRDGAEWMLNFLDRLFDYLIIGPAKDQKMRETWDENVAEAGRKPIPPLLDESVSENGS